MNKKMIATIALFSVFALIFAGCTTDKAPDDVADTVDPAGTTYPAPDITGEIMEVSGDDTLRVLVNSDNEMVTGEIWVTVNEDTIFIDPQGNKFEPEDAESLFNVGDRVSFLSVGEIMESYPMQTTAVNVYLDE